MKTQNVHTNKSPAYLMLTRRGCDFYMDRYMSTALTSVSQVFNPHLNHLISGLRIFTTTKNFCTIYERSEISFARFVYTFALLLCPPKFTYPPKKR